jgi:hypothetical protein
MGSANGTEETNSSEAPGLTSACWSGYSCCPKIWSCLSLLHQIFALL